MRDKNRCGPRIAAARSQHGWSQERLAAEVQLHGLDLARGAVGKIEAGIRCVTDIELRYFALALGVSTDWLVGLDDGT